MARNPGFLPVYLLILAAAARADLAGVEPWSKSESLGPYAPPGEYGQYRFLEVEDVAFISQEMKVTLTYPNRVSFVSDYAFEVKKPGPPVLTAFIPDSGLKWGDVSGYDAGGFKISVRGKEVDDALIRLPRKINANVTDPAFVFPLDFGAAGPCDVRVEYSYVLKDQTFSGLSSAELCGLEYSLGPARYWAGDVERIRVTVLLEGGDVRDLGRIYPPDFTFIPGGVRWEWRNVADEFIREAPMRDELKVGVFFCEPSELRGDVTTVISDAGVNVRAGPGTGYDVITTLPKGARLYVFEAPNAEDQSRAGVSDERWHKCRLFDNTEGYVCSETPEGFLLDSYAARKAEEYKKAGIE